MARREEDEDDPLAVKFVSVVRLEFRSGELAWWKLMIFVKFILDNKRNSHESRSHLTYLG